MDLDLSVIFVEGFNARLKIGEKILKRMQLEDFIQVGLLSKL
jgi:hypothetical protein